MRNTAAFLQDRPTPCVPNDCSFDDAPLVTTVTPTAGSTNVPADLVLNVSFSEVVIATGMWAQLACSSSGNHSLAASGGPQHFSLTPASPLAPGETCVAAIVAAQVSDLDADDPPDLMAADFIWQFTMAETNLSGY
jgi:hypothetical protein